MSETTPKDTDNTKKVETTAFTVPEFTYDEDMVDEILADLEETGDYRNIEIRRGLKASFLKESKNMMGTVLRISFRFGNGDGPTLKIPKENIILDETDEQPQPTEEDGKKSKKADGQPQPLETILTNKLKSCVRDFDAYEIKLIAKIGLSALKNSVAYNENDEMSLERTLSELYYMAYNQKRYPKGRKEQECIKLLPEYEQLLLEYEKWRLERETYIQGYRKYLSTENFNTEEQKKLSDETTKEFITQKRIRLDEITTAYKDFLKEDNSLANITLINDSRFGECICINEKRNVFGEVLEYIGCNKTVLQLKKDLRDERYLITDNGNPYSCLIQTQIAKELGVRKVVKIPVKRIEAIVKPIKEEIRTNILNKKYVK